MTQASIPNSQASLSLTISMPLSGTYPSSTGTVSGAFLGELGIFAGSFAPGGAPLASGELLPISGNEALFTLLGTIYGGDGQQTFALPDLNGTDMIGTGTGAGLDPEVLGVPTGTSSITLTTSNLPADFGGMSAPFNNYQPSLPINYIIDLTGIYPSQNSGTSQPFLGEVVPFAGDFAPAGWAFCDGQVLSINQNQALFSLLGTQYGGNGVNTFALPDLRGRTIIGASTTDPVGTVVGQPSVSLTDAQMPASQGGGGQPFDNREPSLAMNYLVALNGIFPPQDGGGALQDTPYLGQIVAFAGNFAPGGWALTDGQLLPINQNQALFSLLGTQFGGDGRQTFALPNLMDRTIVGSDASLPVGTELGANSETIDASELPPPCYLAGTLIATERGELPVETLSIGDQVMTAAGKMRTIKWIGRRSYSGRFACGAHVLPVCIKAGALDDHVPRRDLWISPHHAMFLEGVLIEALDLVNGVSIVQAERCERIDYVHIELESHDLLIAEGAASESFVDDDSRAIFQNAHEFEVLYPDAIAQPARFCAPRAAFGSATEHARRRIAKRAGIAYVSAPPAARPQALVIDSLAPRFGHSGGANAVLDHVRALQAAGFEVSFLATRERPADASDLSALGVKLLRRPVDATPGEILRRNAGRFQLVYLHRVENARIYTKIARQYFDAQIVYSVADLHHVRLKGQSLFERDPEHIQRLVDECGLVALWELSAAIAADAVVTHSVAEAEQLRTISTIASKTRVLPWSVPAEPVRRPFADRSGIAFVGGFAHAPNIDAARWLVDEIMPLVWLEESEMQCLIVGVDLSDDLRRELARPRIDVLGRVDRLGEVFERIRCTIAPLRFGAGLKDKVLRSMAAGLPCVGTSEAFSGMQELPVAIKSMCQGKTAFDLASALVRLHRDERANAACAQIGLSYIGKFYSQSRIDELMQEIARPALDRQRARPRPKPHGMVLKFGGRSRSMDEAADTHTEQRHRRILFK